MFTWIYRSIPKVKGSVSFKELKLNAHTRFIPFNACKKNNLWATSRREFPNTLSDYLQLCGSPFFHQGKFANKRLSVYTFLPEKKKNCKKKFTLPAPKPKLSRKSLISAPGLVPNLFSRKRSGRKASGSSKKSSRVTVSLTSGVKSPLAFN